MNRITVLIVFLILVLLGCQLKDEKNHNNLFEQSAAIKKKPYLIYTGVNTEMRVQWQQDDSGTSTLAWGTDTSYSMGSMTSSYKGSGSNYRHYETITGLNPATKYYYRVTVGSNNYNGNFQTAPSTGAKDAKFFVYGDTRSNPSSHNQVTGSMIDTYTTDPEFQSLVCHVADYTAGDTEDEWQNEYFSLTGLPNNTKMFSEVPFIGVQGNHETDFSGLDLMAKYYRFPYHNNTFYYSVDYGPAKIICLDTQSSVALGSTQYNWLESELQSTSKKWIFIICHKPGYEGGSHSPNSDIRDDVQPLCVHYGVDAIFAGHNHHYWKTTVGGVYHVTTGGGGASSSNLHHCEVTIACDTWTVIARDENGTVIDSFGETDSTITCTQDPPVAVLQGLPPHII